MPMGGGAVVVSLRRQQVRSVRRWRGQGGASALRGVALRGALGCRRRLRHAGGVGLANPQLVLRDQGRECLSQWQLVNAAIGGMMNGD
jgi:hypothetical protein